MNRRSEYISTDLLMLDKENPRLASVLIDNKDPSQEELIGILWKHMDVAEVAMSIAENGYLDAEPLVAISDKKSGNYIVVEGNRRLAAVKALLGNVKPIKAELPSIAKKAQERLKNLPVIVEDGRKGVWPLLGFKHINGPRRWDAFEKAQYVVSVMENYNITVEEVARKIGDRHSTVKRIVIGYYALKQAEEAGIFSISQTASKRKRFFFSHLYSALTLPGFQKYIGLDNEPKPTRNPIPKKKFAAFNQVLLWLYGDKNRKIDPLVESQNPDLGDLNKVLQSDTALSVLKAYNRLDLALEETESKETRFDEAFYQAQLNIEKALSLVAKSYLGKSEMLKDASDMMKQIQFLYDKMKAISENTPKKKSEVKEDL